LSAGAGRRETDAFGRAIRYLIIVQGVVIAPMLVWAKPIVHLLLGSGYGSSVEVLRVLTVTAFVSAPAALISVTVTYLGEGRRRVAIMLGSLVIGLVSTYVLLRAVGLVGAAIADDIVQVVYVSTHLWLCSRLIALDLPAIARSAVRSLTAAAAMALPLLAFGTGRLSAVGWIVGLSGGLTAYVAVLLATRELSVGELQALAGRIRARVRRG
jgi:O-antigen/teichoic acid export membrane protein